MIEISSLRAGSLSVPALSVRPGKVALIGPNGSGKTTLLEVIAGLAIPLQGSVLILGREPAECSIGWIGEFPDLNMTFTRVFDEIASPLRFARLPCPLIEMKTRSMAERCGLAHLLDRPVRALSGGEKVLVALGAALIRDPEILILDETDSHLDPVTLRRVDLVVGETKPPLVLFATHRPDRIATADRVIRINHGKVSGSGTPDEVYREEQGSPCNQSLHRVLRDPSLWRRVHENCS
jgi:ABC-type multidrug transport system ATPase subunit